MPLAGFDHLAFRSATARPPARVRRLLDRTADIYTALRLAGFDPAKAADLIVDVLHEQERQITQEERR